MIPSQEHLPSSGGTRVVIPAQPRRFDRWIQAQLVVDLAKLSASIADALGRDAAA
jgi:hypothetical protein